MTPPQAQRSRPGDGFFNGTTGVLVGAASAAFQIVSDAELAITVPPSLANGTYSLTITNAAGTTTLPNAFAVTSVITSSGSRRDQKFEVRRVWILARELRCGWVLPVRFGDRGDGCDRCVQHRERGARCCWSVPIAAHASRGGGSIRSMGLHADADGVGVAWVRALRCRVAAVPGDRRRRAAGQAPLRHPHDPPDPRDGRSGRVAGRVRPDERDDRAGEPRCHLARRDLREARCGFLDRRDQGQDVFDGPRGAAELLRRRADPYRP